MNKWIVIFFLSALTGCSTFPKPTWFQSIDELIENHHYKQAIHQVETTNPIDQTELKRIHHKANLYRNKQIKYIQTLLIKKQWGLAEIKLKELQESVPISKKIDALKAQLNQLKSEEAISIKAERYLTEARLIKDKQDELAFKKRLHTASWHEASTLESQANKLSRILLTLSEDALELNKLLTAKRTLVAAKELNPELTDSALEKQINQRISKKQKATHSQIKANFLIDLEQAIEDENFERIIKVRDQIIAAKYKGKKISAVLQKADLLLKSSAMELDELADLAYRNGNIPDAINLWQQSQSLYPTLPNVKEKLFRAQKVFNKLKQLRDSQGQ